MVKTRFKGIEVRLSKSFFDNCFDVEVMGEVVVMRKGTTFLEVCRELSKIIEEKKECAGIT